MSYYCTECKKEHSDKYYNHVKYKKVKKSILEVLGEDPVELEFGEALKMIDGLAESEPQAFVNSHEIGKISMEQNELYAEFCGLKVEIAELKKKLNTIHGILIHWKMFIDRKHPYADADQELFDDL